MCMWVVVFESLFTHHVSDCLCVFVHARRNYDSKSRKKRFEWSVGIVLGAERKGWVEGSSLNCADELGLQIFPTLIMFHQILKACQSIC